MDTNMPELDSSGLRRFGLTMAGVLAVLLGLVLPWLYGYFSPLWLWILVSVLIAWSLILPTGLRLVYRGWMSFALVFGKVNSYLLLSLVFIFVFLPAGMFMRLVGYDPLQRKTLAHTQSYRKQSVTKEPDTMEKPY